MADFPAILAFSLLFGGACADTTSPSRTDLNGDWSTGHSAAHHLVRIRVRTF